MQIVDGLKLIMRWNCCATSVLHLVDETLKNSKDYSGDFRFFPVYTSPKSFRLLDDGDYNGDECFLWQGVPLATAAATRANENLLSRVLAYSSFSLCASLLMPSLSIVYVRGAGVETGPIKMAKESSLCSPPCPLERVFIPRRQTSRRPARSSGNR